MKTIRTIFIGACAVAMAVAGAAQGAEAATAGSAAGPKVCSGTLAPGTYPGLVTKGVCIIKKGPVTIAGNVTVTSGSIFNAVSTAVLTVAGDINVGRGAIVGLGCGSDEGCKMPTPDNVHGDITADHPLDLIIESGTIYGSVSMTGGGGGKNCKNNPVLHSPNFSSIEDTTVRGDVSFTALRTCWLGIIRDQIHGNLTLLRNKYADPDADEIVTNVLYGNATCRRNSPAPQVGDSGGNPNVVFGTKSGQCRNLP